MTGTLYEDVVAARLLDVSVETVRRRARKMEGAKKIGASWFVPHSWLGSAYLKHLAQTEARTATATTLRTARGAKA